MFEPSTNNMSRSVSWNALMEAQFLLDLATDVHKYDTTSTAKIASLKEPSDDECVQKNDSGGTFYTSAIAPTSTTNPAASISTPQWSLTVLAEDAAEDTGPLLHHATFGQRINKSIMRNKKKLKNKWKLKRHLPLESFYQSPVDWEDLYLVRKMLGGKGQSSESEVSSENSEEVNSEESDLNYNLDQVLEDNVKKFDSSIAVKKPKRPVEEIIRKKVLEAREGKVEIKKLSKIASETEIIDLDEISKLPPTFDLAVAETSQVESKNMESTSVEPEEALEVIISPEYVQNIEIEKVNKNESEGTINKVYNFRKRKFEEDKVEVKNMRRRKKHQRSTKWYEKQPFKDPVLEAKRLRSLRAKINHDKNRFDMEILKVDAQELKDENFSLKEELQKFKQREAELMQKLRDKEAAEARVKDLEREVELRRKNEKVLKLQLQHRSETKNFVLVQVWWKFH